MVKFLGFIIKFVLIFTLLFGHGMSVERIYHPYGVNGWFWDLGALLLLKKAHILNCRVMVNWEHLEPEDDEFRWTGAEGTNRVADFDFHLVNLRADNRCAKNKTKISLCVYNSPKWARKDPQKVLSYDPEEYSEFVIELLKYCDSRAPGIVEAVEITDNEPTGAWISDKPPVHGTDQRDPSWYYADILKAAYKAVKSYNPDILVVTDGIWSGAYHHLDELYQLGCKEYFDRINLHYYTDDLAGGKSEPENPSNIGVQHFRTVLGYLKSIADRNKDTKPIWVTEFGWQTTEKKKATYLEYVLDTCRKTGFVERVNYYKGTSHLKDSPGKDTIGLIHTQTFSDEDEEFGWAPISYSLTKAYDKHKKFAQKHPVWDKKGKVDFISGASKDADIINPGFESGKEGWKGEFVTDSDTKHSGKYSAKVKSPGKLENDTFSIQQNKLYEVSFWVKVNGASSDSVICIPYLDYLSSSGEFLQTETTNCWGIVDTRKYPGAWRRIVFPAVPPKNSNLCKVKFEIKGEGKVYIDDIKMNGLDLNYLN